MKRNKNLVCCICGCEITHAGFDKGEYFGNNPYPVEKNPDARCCDGCNISVIIPARIAQLMLNEQY